MQTSDYLTFLVRAGVLMRLVQTVVSFLVCLLNLEVLPLDVPLRKTFLW